MRDLQHRTHRFMGGLKLKPGMQLKYFGSKSWLALRLDLLLGGAALALLRFRKAGVLPCPEAPGPGGAWRRRLRARRKPAPLLLEARPGLPAFFGAPGGARRGQALLLQAPPAGRAERPCRAQGGLRVAAQQLLGKAFARQQQPLPPSCVRRLQQPPSNVTVRHQDALAYLRALPCLAPQQTCIYADPPYIFPGRSMNFYGTRGEGHDPAFHSELRDALFASGLPFVASVSDVPEARELYSRADSITSLRSGKNCW